VSTNPNLTVPGRISLATKERLKVKGKDINQAGTKSWGRSIPGVSFGPWKCVFEKGNICEYERAGIEHSTGMVIKQVHSNAPTKPVKPIVKVTPVVEEIEFDTDKHSINIRKKDVQKMATAEIIAEKMKEQGWSYVD